MPQIQKDHQEKVLNLGEEMEHRTPTTMVNLKDSSAKGTNLWLQLVQKDKCYQEPKVMKTIRVVSITRRC